MLNQDNSVTTPNPDPGSLAALELAVAELRQAGLADVRRRKAELAADLRRTLDADRERAEERRRSEEAQRGGPCRYCGVEFSCERGRDGVVRSRWYEAQGGACCAWCNRDRVLTGGVGTDADHRGRVLRQVLGPEVIGHWVMPYLLDRTDFKWWYETPGAAPGDHQRFTYLDRTALGDRLRPAELPPLQSRAEPCFRCGCAHMFRLDPGHDGGTEIRWSAPALGSSYDRDGFPVKGTLTEIRHVRVLPSKPHLVCVGCASFDDFHRVIERLCGVNFSVAQDAADALGLSWYGHLPEGDERRKLTLAPFAYLGDVAELRRRVPEAAAVYRQRVLDERRAAL